MHTSVGAPFFADLTLSKGAHGGTPLQPPHVLVCSSQPTSKLDQSRSDLFPDQTASASLSDRL
jgi:hypothetical protein